MPRKSAAQIAADEAEKVKATSESTSTPEANGQADRDGSPEVFVATESFACEVDGEPYSVRRNKTRVFAGHPLLKAHPHYFQPASEGPVLGRTVTR